MFTCRSCGFDAVESVVSLGNLPLVNVYPDPADPTPDATYPLDVVRCTRCTLVQLEETVDPVVLFGTYTYFSSYSDSFLDHARDFADAAIRTLGLDVNSFVVEVASNDGYLLRNFVAAGIPALGIEPAVNVADVARSRGVETVAEFLDPGVAETITRERGEARLVVANNVLAHVPEPNPFVAALALLAGAEGLVSVEVPYVRDLIDRVEFDTIYHEHVSYFSLTAIVQLFRQNGLVVVDVERLPVHGGSLRVSASRTGDPTPAVANLLAEEEAWGMSGGAAFGSFADNVRRATAALDDLVHEFVGSGKRVAAYGAAAKGVVLANVAGLDATLVEFVVDRNPLKQHRMLPGVRIPVRPVEDLADERPDYCVLFAWNLASEIVAQQERYRVRGGHFVVPLPNPRIID